MWLVAPIDPYDDHPLPAGRRAREQKGRQQIELHQCLIPRSCFWRMSRADHWRRSGDGRSSISRVARRARHVVVGGVRKLAASHARPHRLSRPHKRADPYGHRRWAQRDGPRPSGEALLDLAVQRWPVSLHRHMRVPWREPGPRATHGQRVSWHPARRPKRASHRTPGSPSDAQRPRCRLAWRSAYSSVPSVRSTAPPDSLPPLGPGGSSPTAPARRRPPRALPGRVPE